MSSYHDSSPRRKQSTDHDDSIPMTPNTQYSSWMNELSSMEQQQEKLNANLQWRRGDREQSNSEHDIDKLHDNTHSSSHPIDHDRSPSYDAGVDEERDTLSPLPDSSRSPPLSPSSDTSSFESPPPTAFSQHDHGVMAPPSTAFGNRGHQLNQDDIYSQLQHLQKQQSSNDSSVTPPPISPPGTACIERENHLILSYDDANSLSSSSGDHDEKHDDVEHKHSSFSSSSASQRWEVNVESDARNNNNNDKLASHFLPNKSSSSSSSSSTTTATTSSPPITISLDSSLYVPSHLEQQRPRRNSSSSIILPKLQEKHLCKSLHDSNVAIPKSTGHSSRHSPVLNARSFDVHDNLHEDNRRASMPKPLLGNVAEQAAEMLRQQMAARRQSLGAHQQLPSLQHAPGPAPSSGSRNSRRDSLTVSQPLAKQTGTTNNNALPPKALSPYTSNDRINSLSPFPSSQRSFGISLTSPPSQNVSRSHSPSLRPRQLSSIPATSSSSTASDGKASNSPGKNFLQRPSTPFGAGDTIRRRSLPPIGLQNVAEKLENEAKAAQD